MQDIFAIPFFLIAQLSQKQKSISEQFTGQAHLQISCHPCGSLSVFEQ
jgi:hypothetical protein